MYGLQVAEGLGCERSQFALFAPPFAHLSRFAHSIRLVTVHPAGSLRRSVAIAPHSQAFGPLRLLMFAGLITRHAKAAYQDYQQSKGWEVGKVASAERDL